MASYLIYVQRWPKDVKEYCITITTIAVSRFLIMIVEWTVVTNYDVENHVYLLN